ncbi:MAG: hypothetical protein E3J52_01645 [Promethearchaeota archaeon]|nr:MAG: hypothetical protein E3J52_01645 [Candidatus Lokiarchaeota archaeon]
MLKTGRFSNSITLTSPYSLKESLGRIKRTVFGLNKNNEGNVDYISKNHIANKITPKYTITFIGDIMDMNFKNLIIDDGVKKFVRGSDYLIGNFEGTITSKKKIMNKRHKPQILDALETMFSPKKTYLSLANNHSGDFGICCFSHSVNQLEERDFNVFGAEKSPFVDLNEDVRVTGSTRWSNRPCNYLIELEESYQYLKKDSCNILFPHWGYELELYPRIETINHGRIILDKFDLLIGHHSHCPQPLSFLPFDNINKLIAYSLGDFCSGIGGKKLEMMNYGIIIKTEIGTNPEGKWLVGKVDWSFLKSRSISKKESIVETTNNISNLFM